MFRKSLRTKLIAGAVLVLGFASPALAVSAPLDGPKVLVLYDGHGSDLGGKYGLLNAILLQSVLGHFRAAVDILPVEAYAAKKMEAYAATFYLGSYFDNPVPQVFLQDAMETSKKLVWLKYNIWQLAAQPQFAAKFGMHYDSFRTLNAVPSATNPAPGFFDTVLYKGKSMVKYYSYDARTNVASADPDIAVLKIDDPVRARMFAQIKNSKTGEIAPWALRSGNFWYLADIPFSYISPQDRYLAFCDLLHDMLDIDHPENHRALVRLEDVSSSVVFSSMKTLADYMHSQKVPFSVATIPFYRDPLGEYNGGTPVETHLHDAKSLVESLRYAIARGGSVVTHGYTHQLNELRNPHTGVSGDDFEFWDMTADAPVLEDSLQWASSRVDAADQELLGEGFQSFAFEAPHYRGSPVDYRAFMTRYKTMYHRVSYYTSENPVGLDSSDPSRDLTASLYFPFVIYNDYYGQHILPENLGSMNFDPTDPDQPFLISWKTLLANAEYSLVVRDGFASFFFHPFWLEPDLHLPQAIRDFKSLVGGIKKLGYEFVDPRTLAAEQQAR